ncbi:GntR family transcriptional regulator [Salinispora tropica]|uniref:GntR family transcriptional regulator n=1 Tax=Salinispora tropica TaxID=168695 RepID=UPI0009B848C6|nr:GntR family transcriptional regulator [Salinispora tropica]
MEQVPDQDRRLPSRRIADDLRGQIKEGQLAPGAKLPSEREMATRYGTARNTAREAVAILQAEGLVDAQHGRGVFVRSRPPVMRLGSNRYSRRLRGETGLSPFRIEITKQGRTPRTECRSVTREVPPEEVAKRLGVEQGRPVIRRENWYFADDEPVQFGVTYIPVDVAGDSSLATDKKLGRGSIYARFEELGYPIMRIREEISARMPTPEESAGLTVPSGVPVIEVTHTSLDGEKRPFEVTKFVMRGDLNALDYEMPVED